MSHLFLTWKDTNVCLDRIYILLLAYPKFCGLCAFIFFESKILEAFTTYKYQHTYSHAIPSKNFQISNDILNFGRSQKLLFAFVESQTNKPLVFLWSGYNAYSCLCLFIPVRQAYHCNFSGLLPRADHQDSSRETQGSYTLCPISMFLVFSVPCNIWILNRESVAFLILSIRVIWTSISWCLIYPHVSFHEMCRLLFPFFLQLKIWGLWKWDILPITLKLRRQVQTNFFLRETNSGGILFKDFNE